MCLSIIVSEKNRSIHTDSLLYKYRLTYLLLLTPSLLLRPLVTPYSLHSKSERVY